MLVWNLRFPPRIPAVSTVFWGCSPLLMLDHEQSPGSRHHHHHHHHGCLGLLLLPSPRSDLPNARKAQLQAFPHQAFNLLPLLPAPAHGSPQQPGSTLSLHTFFVFLYNYSFTNLLLLSKSSKVQCKGALQPSNVVSQCTVLKHSSTFFLAYGLSLAYLLPCLHPFKCL